MTVETDDEASKRVFYTAHYHTMIAPTLFCDVNGEYLSLIHILDVYKRQVLTFIQKKENLF